MNRSEREMSQERRASNAWSATLDNRLAAIMQQNQAFTEVVDSLTVRFEAVPISDEFSKPRTNLLLQRAALHSGASAYVDADLAYDGPNRRVNTALSGPCRQSWRRLRLPPLMGSISEAVSSVLGLLGSPLAPKVRRIIGNQGRNPAASEDPGGVFATAEVITREMAAVAYDESFRQGLARQLAVLPTRPTAPRSVLLWGRSGSGLDHLMLAAVHPLYEVEAVTSAYRVSASQLAAGCIFSQELDASLAALLKDAGEIDGCLLLVKDLDVCVTGSPVSHCLLCDALDKGLRMFASVRSEAVLGRLRDDEATARRLLALNVPPPDADQTFEVLQRFADASQIEVSRSAIETAVRITDSQGAAQPAGAIALLAAAIAEATWAGRSQVTPDDLLTVPNSPWLED